VHVHQGDLFASPAPTGATLPLADVALHHPVRPGKVIAMVNNFRALLAKLNLAQPTEPLYVLKPPNTYLDPGATIAKPACDSRIVFEGELGVVIGRRCQSVSEAQALDHVLGYTCVNTSPPPTC
jgi:2-keto-4-pentenoate hydratase/2-oxohepta-3-ene-1,7-dioic acid hydratase in catechol pathway